MKRRNFIQTTVAGVAVTVFPHFQLLASEVGQPNEAGILGQKDWRFKLVKDWGVQDPKKTPVHNLHEIAQDKAGLIYVAGDHTKNNILVYKADGTLVKTMLTDLPSGHGLTLATDEEGAEFLWITNADARNGFVRKIDLDGKTVLELKRPPVKSYEKADSKFAPTEVEVNPENGDIYVADGYGSSLLTRYDCQGKVIDVYGVGEDFRCMHGVRLDQRNPKRPLLWVTSRVQQQIRLLTLEGKLVETIHFPGAGPCRATFVDDHVVIPMIWIDQTSTQPQQGGFVMILGPDNKPVSFVGGLSEANAAGKKAYAQDKSAPTPFIYPHDTYIDSAGDLYVAQWNSRNTYPLKLARV